MYDETGKLRVQVNSAADGFILDSEIGPELVYHLAKHPDELEELSDLSPYQTVRKLTILEQTLQGGLKTPRKLSNAPEPPKDVGGRGAAASTPRPLEEIFYGKS